MHSKTLETQVMMQNDKCLFSDERISDTIESSRNTMMRQPMDCRDPTNNALSFQRMRICSVSQPPSP